jgi:hypothetical protein
MYFGTMTFFAFFAKYSFVAWKWVHSRTHAVSQTAVREIVREKSTLIVCLSKDMVVSKLRVPSFLAGEKEAVQRWSMISINLCSLALCSIGVAIGE